MGRIVVLGAILAAAMGSAIAFAQGEIGDPGRGQLVYEANCLRCHGKNLDGNGPDGWRLIVPPANFQSLASRSKADWELMVPILDGVMFTPMHGWRGRLKSDQIRDVLSYIRIMAPFEEVR